MRRTLVIGLALVALAGVGVGLVVRAQQGGPEAKPEAKKSLPALLKDLKDKDDGVRLSALGELADHGPKAEPAVNTLVGMLRESNEDIRLNAAIVLGKIGKASVPPLEGLLADKDDDVRYYAVWALGLIGP